ncbi:hypothetical protein EV2_023344 [Malus domestica]
MARLTCLEAKAHYFTNDDICAGLVPGNTAEFMDNISIGEPPVPQLISIDSGSNVVWVQCPSSTKYVGGSIVDGLVRTEKFTFETSDEGISTVLDVFGCASHTDPHYGNAS